MEFKEFFHRKLWSLEPTNQGLCISLNMMSDGMAQVGVLVQLDGHAQLENGRLSDWNHIAADTRVSNRIEIDRNK